MTRYVIYRFIQMIIVFFLFLVLSYILFDAIPGNAFQNLLLNPDLPDYAYDQIVELYGLNDPLITRIQNLSLIHISEPTRPS